MSGEKTEQATPKRLRKARQDGDVPKSAEFTGALVLMLTAATVWIGMTNIVKQLLAMMKYAITLASRPQVTTNDISAFLSACVQMASVALAPILGVAFVAAAFLTYVQIGAIWTIKPLTPDTKKLDPASGLKQMFSKDKGVELIKNLLKLGIIGAVGYVMLLDLLPQLVQTPKGSLSLALAAFEHVSTRLLMALIGVLFVFGALDLLWQRHKHRKKLMMTKDEVKREYKESEGDPMLKGQRRQLHQELINEPGMARIADADAVVVNPTHLAVALQYRAGAMDAPMILVSGRGAVAQHIKRVAKQYRVPIVKNVPLARGLIDLPAGEEIPPDFYDTVAEVLLFVQSLKR